VVVTNIRNDFAIRIYSGSTVTTTVGEGWWSEPDLLPSKSYSRRSSSCWLANGAVAHCSLSC